MKYISFLIFFIAGYSHIAYTQDSIIEQLNQLLFPVEVQVKKSKTFKWKDDVYEVVARDFKYEEESINKQLAKVRNEARIELIDDLIAIQKKHETYFLQEWEKSWRIGHYMFEQQYEILMNLELTINFLYALNEFESEKEQYLYFKNLCYLQWIDAALWRKDKFNFFSDYIKSRWNGACIASSFCTPSLIIEQSNQFKEGILEDLNTFLADTLGSDEYSYYLVTLGQSAMNINDNRVEDIYIKRIEEFDALVIGEKNKYGREIWIYNILCTRAQSKGLEFLVNDLSSDEILNAESFISSKICRTEEGTSLYKKRLIEEIKKYQNTDIQRGFVKEYIRIIKSKNIPTDDIQRFINKGNLDLFED